MVWCIMSIVEVLSCVEEVVMSIVILLLMIVVSVLVSKVLKVFQSSGKIDGQRRIYHVINKLLYHMPMLYAFVLFTYWSTDTKIEWMIVSLYYSVVLILWTIYGKFLFGKKLDVLLTIIISLCTYIVHGIAVSKMLYGFSFGIFMVYYLNINFSSKEGISHKIKAGVIFLIIITSVTYIGDKYELEKVKPEHFARNYMDRHYEKDVDYHFHVDTSFFELHEPVYISVWKNFSDDNRELVELFYYRDKIYKKTSGSINDFKKEILEKERNK